MSKGDDRELRQRLKKLGKRLDALPGGKNEAASSFADGRRRGGAQAGEALRLGSEMIAGVAVGAFLGWWLDRLAGTAPWGMAIMLLLGVAAGFLNIFRQARRMEREKAEMAARGEIDLGRDLPVEAGDEDED
jgi:ATP synthase protein I